MTRTGLWTVLLPLMIATPLRAQTSQAVNEVKAKIWEAQLVQRNFAAGLRHCNELNGALLFRAA
jgi:hypothetical protein